MAAGTTIPIKTARGQAELAARQRRVGQRHRTMLFLVDGKRPTDEVLTMAAQAGVPDSCFDELMKLGLIALIESEPPPAPGAFRWPDTPVLDPALPMADEAPSSLAADTSLLPSVRTLYPSMVSDSVVTQPSTPPPSEFASTGGGSAAPAADPIVEQVRTILIRAVRAQAPVVGSLTVLKLKRARSRADLERLLDEVEARIMKPHHSLAAGQTIRRVRHLLRSRVDSTVASA